MTATSRLPCRMLMAVLVATAAISAAVDIVPIHPAPNQFVPRDEFLVVAKIIARTPFEQVDLFFDNEPIDSGMTLTDGGVIRWTPDTSTLTAAQLTGTHTVTVLVPSPNGTPIATRSWQFTLLQLDASENTAPTENRLSHNGRVFTELNQYSLNGDNTWEALSGGTYRASYGKLRYGTEILLTNLNEDNTQDRNVLRADIAYGRSLLLKVGDTRPSFHPAILAGKRIRGLEAGFHAFLPSGLNIANLDIAWGQAKRAAIPDTYRRTLFAARASFGSGRHFQLGFTFLKGRDDTASVHPSPDTLLLLDSITTSADTLFDTAFVAGRTPEDNLVVGADLIARFFDRRLVLHGSYAFSLFTRDIGDSVALTRADLTRAFGEQFDFDPNMLGNLMILNTSSLPLSGGRGVLNASHITAGLRLHLPFQIFTEDFAFTYKLQGATYHSMGNSLLGSGEQGFSVSDKLLLLNNRMVIETHYGRYWNNLDQLNAQPTVSSRFSVSTGFFYSPRVPSLTLRYDYNAAANQDSTYGFENGVNQFNLTSAYRYRTRHLEGMLHLFCSWSAISNGWREVSFVDTGIVRGMDTATTFGTGVYGVQVRANIAQTPLSLDGGLSTNAGSNELLRLVTGNVRATYRFIPSRLSGTLGLHLGGTRMPDDTDYAFHLRIPFGIDATIHKAHHAVWQGYTVIDGGDFDLVNMFRYQWQF